MYPTPSGQGGKGKGGEEKIPLAEDEPETVEVTETKCLGVFHSALLPSIVPCQTGVPSNKTPREGAAKPGNSLYLD